MRKLITALGCMTLLFIQSQAQGVLQGEYFFNSDPGVGHGTAITVAQDASISETFWVDVSSLSPGFQSLYVRLRQNGVWGHYGVKRVFYIESQADQGVQHPIEAAEYFFDNDPGVGNGIDIPIDATASLSGIYELDVSALEPGFHGWYVRTKQNGAWGHYGVKRIFYIDQQYTVTAVPIDRVEGFVNSDPGVGNGTVIDITPGTSVNGIASIPIGMLAPGVHQIYL